MPLELTLTVININKGRNTELVSKSKILSGYVEFIDRVTRHIKAGMDRSEAIEKTVHECIAKNILKDYLLKHGSEVNNMLLQEWNTQTAKEVWAEEAYRKAKAEDKEEIDRITTERDQIATERDQIVQECDRIAFERDQIAIELAEYKSKYGQQ